MQIHRGEIYMARLEGYPQSSVQAGFRPVLIMTSAAGLRNSDVVSVLPITTKKKDISIYVDIELQNMQLSQVLTNQMTTIPRRNLQTYVSMITDEKMREVEAALLIAIGISKYAATTMRDSAAQLASASQDLKELREKIPHAVQLIGELTNLINRYKEVSGKKTIGVGGMRSSLRTRRTEEELKELVKRFYRYKEPKEDLIRDFSFTSAGAFYQCVSSAKKKYPEAAL